MSEHVIICYDYIAVLQYELLITFLHPSPTVCTEQSRECESDKAANFCLPLDYQKILPDVRCCCYSAVQAVLARHLTARLARILFGFIACCWHFIALQAALASNPCSSLDYQSGADNVWLHCFLLVLFSSAGCLGIQSLQAT